MKQPRLDVDFVRRQFPYFDTELAKRWAFFDNAGGTFPCGAVVDRLTEAANERGQNMGVLRVNVIPGPVKIGRHDRHKFGPILAIVRFTHLQSGNLGQRIRLIGRLQQTCQ